MYKKRRIGKRSLSGFAAVFPAVTVVAVVLLSVVMASCSTSGRAVGASQPSAAAAEMREALESRSYVIDVETASPQRGGLIPLTGMYELKVDGDSVISYLPYFGRAYRSTFRTGSPLDFTGQATGYRQVQTRKKTTLIDFDTKNADESLHYRIEVFDGGRASISVTGIYRERISFEGTLRL